MKKLMFLMVAISMMFATSCQSDVELGTANVGGTSTVSFKINSPVIASRAYSDGLSATVLQYAVYDAAGNELSDLTVTDGTILGSTSVELKLVVGKTYSAIFWAAAPNAPYTIDFAQKKLSVDYSAATSNNESYDAFYKYETFTVTDNMAMTVELKRPFAQLNIGTSDLAAAKSAGYAVSQSKVNVPVYTELDLATGIATNPTNVEFALANIPAGETFPVAGYDYLAMNYLLVNADKEVIDVTFAYTDGDVENSITVGSVPVQRNHRTNIYGELLTNTTDITVVIIPEYDVDDYNKEVTNAVEVAPGVLYDEANATYMLTEKQGLDWLRDEVNAGNTFESKIVTLVNDIDTGIEYDDNGERISFATIGTCSKTVKNPFKGTFDGAGYTIKNIYQNGWDFDYKKGNWGSLGLFGRLEDATVKNVTLEGFELRVEKGNCGGIAGNAAGDCTFENITVKNSILCSYNNGVAGILGWPEAGNYLFKNIVIESDVNIASFWGAHGSVLGGVLAEAYTDGTYHFEDIVVNCRLDAYNDVVSNYQWYAYRVCGMLVGNVETTKEMDGRVVPDPAGCNITCKNVVVNYGDWMNYHYCESPAYGTPSYAKEGQWKFHRVEPGYSYDGVDHNNCNHGENETHYEYIPLDQIFGGGPNGGGGSPVYGLKSYDGVTVNYPASYTPSN
jgi:hypothetical protein